MHRHLVMPQLFAVTTQDVYLIRSWDVIPANTGNVRSTAPNRSGYSLDRHRMHSTPTVMRSSTLAFCGCHKLHNHMLKYQIASMVRPQPLLLHQVLLVKGSLGSVSFFRHQASVFLRICNSLGQGCQGPFSHRAISQGLRTLCAVVVVVVAWPIS